MSDESVDRKKAPDWRRRLGYGLGIAIAIGAGLESRRRGSELPVWVASYAGDTLWALTAYWGISFLFPRAPIGVRGVGALGFAFAIEFSQLYQAEWINAWRQTRLGGLILGFGFLVSDLVCYSVGVLLGVLTDGVIGARAKRPAGDDREGA